LGRSATAKKKKKISYCLLTAAVLLDIARLNDDIGTEWIQIVLITFAAISMVWPQLPPSYVTVFIKKINVGSSSFYPFLTRKVFNMLLKFIK
jgi:hypothetical protein